LSGDAYFLPRKKPLPSAWRCSDWDDANRWDYCKINGIFKPLSSEKKEMNSVETLYRIWVYLQTEPLF